MYLLIRGRRHVLAINVVSVRWWWATVKGGSELVTAVGLWFKRTIVKQMAIAQILETSFF